MNIGIPKETHPGEKRVSLVPSSVERLIKKGADVAIEAGLGAAIRIGDEEYKKAGARLVSDRRALLSASDVILRLRKPPLEEHTQ